MKVAVSILSSKLDEEKESILKINKTTADYLHLDVLDGKFAKVVRDYEYAYCSEKPLDVHLMVANPFNYISKYALKNTEYISISLEIDDDIVSLLDYIKSFNIKCGIAINPETGIDKLEPYLNKIDKVIVLTVTPGASNQEMKQSVLDKIDDLVKLRNKNGYHYEIFIDGGVNGATITKLMKADGVVSDSFIRKCEDYQKGIDILKS